MSDVLDQEEVDALLNAVAGGELDTSEDEDAGPSQGGSIRQQDIRSYDFKRPERVSKDQMRALEGLHEQFSRNFGAALSSYLRTIIEVKIRSAEQLTYAEFIYSLPSPTYFSLLSANPLEGQICLEVSPLIIYPIIDRMLGGGNVDLYIPQRPLTAIEQRLANRITERALATLAEAWSGVMEGINFEVTQTESNPQLVQVVAPNEVVVVIGFDIKSGDRSGAMNLCLPFNVIEPIIGRLASEDWFSNYRHRDAQANYRSSIEQNLKEAPLQMRAYLARTTIRVSELLNLEVGDVISTNKESTHPLVMQVDGKSKFTGRIGQFRGHRAFKIENKAQPGQHI